MSLVAIALLAGLVLSGGRPDAGTVKPMPTWKEHPVKWKMFDGGVPMEDSPDDW